MKKVVADNSYFTPTIVADKLVDAFKAFCSLPSPHILEPCAGNGSLVSALKKRGYDNIDTLEIDPELCTDYGWTQGDFLQHEPYQCDAIVCNPPFSEYRSNGNVKSGKDMACLFLIHAAKFAPLLVFIMHQSKGSLAYDTKFKKMCPHLTLIHRVLCTKKESVYENNGKGKFVPTAIYVYSTRENSPFPCIIPRYSLTGHKTEDFEIILPSDDSAHILVKRWGTLKRTGRIVSRDPSVILEAVTKNAGRTIGQAANFHLKCHIDIGRLVSNLEKMESHLIDHFSYARDCSNVIIRPEEFIMLYNKANE